MTFQSSRLPRAAMFFILLCLLALCMTGWFARFGPDVKTVHGFFFLTSSAIAYSALYMLPALLLLLPSLWCKSAKTAMAWSCLSAIAGGTTLVISMIDAAILYRYGYHINGLVINLLCTRGGFRSMGLDSATLAPAFILVAVIYIVCLAISYACFHWKKMKAVSEKICRPAILTTLAGIWAVAFVYSLLCTGHADFFADTEILAQQDALPYIVTVRMRKFLRSLGFKEPDRKKIPAFADANSEKASLKYPRQDIVRNPNRKKYNIIWLVAESLRADFLKEDIMPQTWKYAQTAARFDNHYSGGHGTRPAMFSMFYGLYGLNWDVFMNQRRGPVFIDWLLEDDYQFLCQTSADFTYPEFDKTIFSALHQDVLVEVDQTKKPWQRDEKLIDDLISFVKNRDKSRPFFTFGFFESTHAPYTFPESAVIREDYMQKINYATVSAKDAQQLYNRDCNAAHYLDTLFAKVVAMLDDDPELRDNTIVVFTGDHGEEFFEKGRLGHNSTFSEEQIRIPLIIKLPGATPSVCEKMTHHTDIVPTLAPYLGVETPAQEYCLGHDLMANYDRQYFLVCGWNLAVLINHDYKFMLPMSMRSAFKSNDLQHRDDSPCTEEEDDTFISRFASQLAGIQEELHRFIDR
ncbi:MAG: sulfatase-like hydrolase/transferase [Lentisphaeria bacterium]|nr:sulfatase-like hydrolase/transferase [Lentisphaeria bacterium]